MKKNINPNMYFGLAVLALLLAAGFLYKQNSSLDAMRGKVAQLQEQTREQDKIYNKLAESKQQLTDLQTKLAHLEQGIPDSAFIPTMLKNLADFGKQQHVEVTGLRPVAVRSSTTPAKDKFNDKKPYEPLDMTLKGKANYTDLLAFVQSLNTFPQIVTVRTLAIQPGGSRAKDGDRRLDVTIGLRAFLFKQVKPELNDDEGGSA